jgi:hypothetical protein
MTFSRTLD